MRTISLSIMDTTDGETTSATKSWSQEEYDRFGWGTLSQMFPEWIQKLNDSIDKQIEDRNK